MAGFDSPYVPGWDCHGLPIEIKVDSELGARRRRRCPRREIRRACRKYAEKYVDLQRQDFKRLGVFGRWDDPYLTMSAEYQAVIAGAFVDFLDRGYVYKGLKPVHWCIQDRTALAEAEVEYENHTSPSIWVRFALTSDPATIDPALAGRKVYGLIWTTTPWTIPANMAIAFHPKFEYVGGGRRRATVYIVADGSAEGRRPRSAAGATPQVVARVPGRAAGRRGLPASVPGARFARHSGRPRHARTGHRRGPHGARPRPGRLRRRPAVRHRDLLPGGCRGPLLPRRGRRGTPARGADRQDGLGSQPDRDRDPEGARRAAGRWRSSTTPIRTAGAATTRPSSAPPSSGSSAWSATTSGSARSTPSSRCSWMPAWGEERISNMIATRPDWCISRQRVWGVPIIVFYCDECREPLTDRKILDGIVELFREHTRRHLVRTHARRNCCPPGTACAKCGGTRVQQGERHSGRLVRFRLEPPGRAQRALRPALARRSVPGRRRPVSRLVPQLAAGGRRAARAASPYRACALNGWVLDGEGRAMHKSLGNAIEPDEVIKQHGAEMLRLWSASVDFNEDVRISRDHPDAADGRLSQAAQHVPLRARQPHGFRPGDRCRAGGRTAGDRPVDSAARRRPGGALPRLVRRASRSTRSITRSTLSPRWT